MRFADDFVIAFKDRWDGERVLAVLGKRLERYGLRLHPTKTQFVDFRLGSGGGYDAQDQFDFLGFTQMWGKSRKGRWVVRQFTARTRLARVAKSVWEWCKQHRHQPLGVQHRHLARVIRGHCAYYGLTAMANSSLASGKLSSEAGGAGLVGVTATGRSRGDGSTPSSNTFPCHQPGSRGPSMPPERNCRVTECVYRTRSGLWGTGRPKAPVYPATGTIDLEGRR